MYFLLTWKLKKQQLSCFLLPRYAVVVEIANNNVSFEAICQIDFNMQQGGVYTKLQVEWCICKQLSLLSVDSQRKNFI